MTIYGCSAVKCVRRSKDFKDITGFTIEHSCPHRDSTCPELKSYKDRLTTTNDTKQVSNNVQETSTLDTSNADNS